MTSAYTIIKASRSEVPIIISVPHCGTTFPDGLSEAFKPELLRAPDDTDWFVQDLYNFATAMGITIIYATYSRWVVDLNRDPESKPLYGDGRIITALCPVTDFTGKNLYRDARTHVSPADQQFRVSEYYKPYHARLTTLLEDARKKFGKVLLWDCHSIRQLVPTIRPTKFPDLILGDADGSSAAPVLTEATLAQLKTSNYSVHHNDPFKGGFITRHYGRPAIHQHALQLEMTKVNYMDDTELAYDIQRAAKIQEVLKRTFQSLIETLNTM